MAATSGAFDSHGPNYAVRGPICAAPAPPGTTMSVRLVDMRAMMTRGGVMAGSGGMMGGSGGMMGGTRGYGGMMRQSDWRHFRRGMMRALASATTVRAGVLSLKVTNTGYLTHELVVLPLADGQQSGARTVGGDGGVDETGSLGEASATCAAGKGTASPPGRPAG